MARKEEATLLIRIKQLGAKTLKSLSSSFGGVVKAIGAAGLAVAGYTAIVAKLVIQGEIFREVQGAFSNMAAAQGEDSDEMLNNMRKLSAGTVSDLKLMQQANNALLLGLPVDKFGDMLTIARSAAKATGESMEFMLKSIVTGMGRGSKLVLDNLGIVFDLNKAYEEYARKLGKTASSLSDAEKKQAFINKALEVGKKNAELAGLGTLSLADRWQQSKVKAENLTTTLGQRLAPAFKVMLDKTGELTDKFEKFATSGAGKDLFIDLTKGVVIFMNGLTTLGDVMGAVLGTAFGAIAQAASGQFAQAWETIKSGSMDTGKVVTDSWQKTKDDMVKIDEEFNTKRQEIVKKDLEAIRVANAMKAQLAVEDKTVQAEIDRIKKEEQLETERVFNEAMKEEKNAAQMAEIDQQILNETNRAKQLDLINQRRLLKEKITNDKRKKDAASLAQFQGWLDSNRVKGAQSIFSQIETLSTSHNKALVAIGKAAGIANAIINTARGVTLALATFPGPFGIALGAAVAAAGAVQIGTIAGVKLAEGGIVPASSGGTPAILGEGGRDEAVVPLDDIGGGIGGNTYVFNVTGGMLGSREEAREFAVAVDQELFNLRKDNESLAFDTDLR